LGQGEERVGLVLAPACGRLVRGPQADHYLQVLPVGLGDDRRVRRAVSVVRRTALAATKCSNSARLCGLSGAREQGRSLRRS
jgi:hypothetical protein